MIVIILPISLQLSPDYGLDLIPTFIAMVLLAIPPILVNAYAGLREVDRDLVEAARGMGMRERQILRGVEVPLASPVIMGGFRTAVLNVIATATIGAVVELRRAGPVHHRRPGEGHRRDRRAARRGAPRRGAGGRHRPACSPSSSGGSPGAPSPEQPRGGGLSDLAEFPLLPELERA